MSGDGALARARRSLEGLSLGDAFGEASAWHGASPGAGLPPEPWAWTDDTHMALSIVEVLATVGAIDQNILAAAFARRFTAEPFRGYGRGAMHLLSQLSEGGNWRALSPSLFGMGSYGNGAAMRVAPVGGYFADDLVRVAHEAGLSAEITHAHPEGRAGAVAVALAAGLAARPDRPTGVAFIREVATRLPPSATRALIERACEIAPGDLRLAVGQLGTGREVSAQDTVPFCIWCAAHHLDDYEAALRCTAAGRGDCDTTCAIVGGIVALSAPSLPSAWLARREPLPAWPGA